MGIFQMRWRGRLGGRALVMAAAIACACVVPAGNGRAETNPYRLAFGSISASSVSHARSSCYQLSGSISFISPPQILYGTSSSYVLFTGFWVAAPTAEQDQLFFNGFEECN